jgi:hypothetical protein
MPKILSYYGSRNRARARFRIRQQRDRFFSTINNISQYALDQMI